MMQVPGLPERGGRVPVGRPPGGPQEDGGHGHLQGGRQGGAKEIHCGDGKNKIRFEYVYLGIFF